MIPGDLVRLERVFSKPMPLFSTWGNKVGGGEMKPGDMVRNRWEGSYIPMYEKPHGIVVSQYLATELGIVLDSCYSSTDVPYIQILISGGNKGWVRYKNVEVLK